MYVSIAATGGLRGRLHLSLRPLSDRVRGKGQGLHATLQGVVCRRPQAAVTES
jgi:hypothetical protein